MQQRAMPDADVTSRCRAISRPGLYTIMPRANRVLSTLPGLDGVDAQVLATPQCGARFVEHELLIHANGRTAKAIDDGLEHFVFVLEGGLELQLGEAKHALVSGGYAWIPAGQAYSLRNRTEETSRVLWLRRRYQAGDSLKVPGAIVANERDVPALPEDTYVEQHLIPYEQVGFDMGFNLLNFDPGIYFGAVEMHIMEHGLYMLAGRGIYWLNGEYHEVQADDFIYMAPYCPQFFYATGWERGRYLLYKDVNRDYCNGI